MPDFLGVVVAAGSSTRFGGRTPKQFLDLAGRSVLERSVRALAGHPGIDGVVVVLAPEELDGEWGRAARGWPGVIDVVAGGSTRTASVRRGVAAAAAGTWLLVHDAARPLVDAQVVAAVMEATRRHGAAVPVVTVPDTVKEVDGDGWVLGTRDRGKLRLAQTPQGSRADWLREALERAEQAGGLTDESAALEAAGHRVAVVPGELCNRKITTSRDLEEARSMLREDRAELRVGSGFDVHRLGAERTLVLGGIEFPGEPGLMGHSDADVVLHAAMDALLGATALGDIGAHFPPDDPAFAGADSAGLTRKVAELLRNRGYRIVNLDLTLLAERPKIRKHVDRMRRRIADCLGLEPERVGLKATTLERLGALGRGEGIACEAVVLVEHRPAG